MPHDQSKTDKASYEYILILVLLVTLALLVGQPRVASPADETELIDFAITTHQGSWRLSDLRGNMVLLFFGYASCPDIYPTSMATVSQALGKLDSEELEKVRGVFISFDPERDTPEQLKAYTRSFHTNIIGVTGKPGEVKTAASEIGVSYRRRSGSSLSDYTFDHSALLFAIAPDGTRIITLASHAVPPRFLVDLVRKTLKDQNTTNR